MKSFLYALRAARTGAFGLALAVGLALPAGPASAAATSIAQVPLLNIDGTGSVRPNLMLLYDNSGSMAQTYTPDYVDDNTTCRSKLVMASGTTGCSVGHPPFSSPDFNRQYYNPNVLYLPPVYADGTSYISLNRDNTTGWTVVTTDVYGKNATDMLGNNASSTNLVTGFPDKKWCDGSIVPVCKTNTATYTYPTDTYLNAVNFNANPYYYNIAAAEYCTDANLTTCVSTGVGAAAPTGYPVAAKVRWCNSSGLTTCQAKYSTTYKYPRFSNPNSGVAGAYGTITIGATNNTTNPQMITSVSVSESGGGVVITNAAVTAAAGTNTAAKQATLANDLAASIVAKTGLANQYTACTRTPTGTVPACSTFGITLPTNNIVAVIAITCTAGTTGKALGPCAMVTDASRNGWALSVATNAFGAVTVAGKSATSGSTSGLTNLASLGLSNGTTTKAVVGSLNFATASSAATVASALATAINAAKVAGVTAVAAKVTGSCNSASGVVCIFTDSTIAAGQPIVLGKITNPNTLVLTTTTTEAIPVTSVAIGAGAQVFSRVDIIPTRTSYPKGSARTDCAGATCTYDEEMTNFANWYGYYKTRNQMMKTAVGQAFQPLTDSYNVGITSLSAAAVGAIPSTGRPRQFTTSIRAAWYDTLYGMTLSGSTPLRPALHAVGKLFANIAPVQAANDEVVSFPCQQNFTFLTTDGYWNGAAAADVVNNDNVENAARFCTAAKGCVDPSAQSGNSLADIALYWYNGGSNGTGASLRTTLENWNSPGLVPGAAGENTRLHMNTYTLGLGVDGIMNYEENYDTAPVPGGDFSNLINKVQTGCPWNNNGPYIWPDPATSDTNTSTVQSRVDDLWHTAINGHGRYFAASDPTSVVAGLRSALSNIATRVGAASAAATSTPNLTQADDDIFSNTFTTVKWNGVITDKKVDVTTGLVINTEIWNTSNTLGKLVSTASDTRVIKMLDTTAGGLKDFQYASMSALEKTWFDNQCATKLAQCASLQTADRATLNAGANIVGWLRGQQQYANDVLLRAYTQTEAAPPGMSTTIPIVLGDIASSKPAYVRDVRKSYPDAAFATYRAANANRAPMVYVGANDGMLHGFDATTGVEKWAYVPRITMGKLPQQASTTYGTQHQFTTDGSPEVADVMYKGKWRSVMVAGLNGGGRGYYAVDVTDPAKPVGMWETCADVAVCTGVNNEPELGLTFGNPQMGTWTDAAGVSHWVAFVASGYNNSSTADSLKVGTGAGWLMILDIDTGKVLAKVSTGSGTVDTPSGLTRITGISANPTTDPQITYIYAGDNLGQMWRFDLTKKGVPTVTLLANGGPLQPITTRADVTQCVVTTAGTNGAPATTANKVVVAYGTGRLLDVTDVTTTDTQSLYVVKDTATPVTPFPATTMNKQTLLKSTGASGDVYTISGTKVDLSTQAGWYVNFDQNKGERVNLDVKIVSGSLNVVTNLPSSSSSCSVGGSSNVYAFDVCSSVGDTSVANPSKTALPTGTVYGGQVGATLSSSSAAVGYIIVSLPDGEKKIIATLANGSQVTLNAGGTTVPVSRRAGWRRIQN